MNISCYWFKKKTLVTVLALAIPVAASAEPSNADLQTQIEALQSQITALNSEVQQTAEWKSPNTLVHIAGYADVGYLKQEGQDSSFVIGSFSPVFHFQYRDTVMLEAELEIEVEDNGETVTALEYLTIDWLFSDYATLVAGKFLSPLGNFRQNLHPSWVNKLPSAPPGFGHDGAAPISDTGFQVRGGYPVGGMKINYAVYTSNGPEINAEETEIAPSTFEYELDGAAAEAFGVDIDGEKTYGGRIGILPFPSLEIGLSIASGKATVTNIEGDDTLTGSIAGGITGETARDYDVTGADFVWFNGDMSIRGEYVKTEIGETTTGATASEGAQWETWYSQIAYRLPDTKWEGVVRYTDYDSPHPTVDQKQTSIGINYLIANNFIAKLAFESNDGLDGSVSDADRTMVQLAYGF